GPVGRDVGRHVSDGHIVEAGFRGTSHGDIDTPTPNRTAGSAVLLEDVRWGCTLDTCARCGRAALPRCYLSARADACCSPPRPSPPPRSPRPPPPGRSCR